MEDNLPPTLVIEHLEGLSFEETITPSVHERLSGAGEMARVQALPHIVDDGAFSEADFTPLEAIAMGGTGVVELAHQRSVGRDVAIKRVRDPSVPGAAAMLLEEGRVMGLLEHPSIIPVLALGRDGHGRPVLVMKRIEGTTWRDLLRDPEHGAWRRFPGDRLEFHLRVLAQVADVAHYAHDRGWLHRDIKPTNVMIGLHGEVYLIDWGLALQVPASASDESYGLVGTPAYMAPEMLKGVGPWLTRQTDVYLLGATLHDVLAGSVRHDGDNLRAVLASAWLSDPYEYPASTPAELAALANESTSPRAERRPASALEFKRRVEAFLEHRVALGLIDDARERFRELRAIAHEGSQPSEVELVQRLDATVALLRRSLTMWPANPAAVEGLTEVLTWRIRRSLARDDVLAAQAAWAELPHAEEGLEAELASAAARISQERMRQAWLSDLGRRHDRPPIAPLRARAARASAVLGGASMVALGAAVRAGVVPLAWSLLSVAGAAALAVVAGAALRGEVRDGNAGPVGLRGVGWILGGALALTVAGRFIGLSPGQTLALLPVLAGVSAGLLGDGLGSARWRLVALCGLAALVAPAVLRWNATYLLDLLGVTTIAGHFVVARTRDRQSDDSNR